MKSHRLARIAEVIREVASTTILFELRDPRVKNVTVTRAEVSADLQHAKVYVSVMGTEKQQQLALYGLEHSAGFIQAKVAKQLATRFVPVLSFILDPGIKKSIEISRLLREERDRDALAAGRPVDATDAEVDAIDNDDNDDEDDDDDDDDDTERAAPGHTAPTKAPDPD
ncbi:MAG: 30S ribosome-binding factor RbfA [Gemmataceae bacterium]